jgi:uncharacterized membrane protein
MEELLLLFGLLVLSGIVAGILAIIAFRRSGVHARQIEDLTRELTSATERLRALERAGAQARVPAAVPAVAPKPAVVAEPPPVVRPPVSTWAPTIREAAEPPPVAAASPAAEEPSVVEAPPVVPPEPPQASAFMRWLTGGNPLAKIGIVLLFFGIAFLVRYAAERDLISIQLRLSSAAVIALGLLAIGWRLRHRSPVYALTLQGGAIGGLYLTSFAAFKIYALLPHGLVFALLIVICAASVALAVLQRAQGLAVLASLGGYLAPILLSTGSGDHVCSRTTRFCPSAFSRSACGSRGVR